MLVGTGLTMVDVALTLTRLAPGTARTARSRHGLAPQPHPHERRPRKVEPLRFDEPVTARSLLRTVREAVEKAMADGDDWTGVVDEVRPVDTGLEVVTRHAGEDRVLRAAAVINCTRPCSDVARGGTPFLRHLVETGIATPHPLGLGVDVDDRGALIGVDGRPSPTVHTLGPLRRGHLFESTAMPEIRVQAAALAGELLAGTRTR